MSYAELHCLSHFTFLRGASHPEELVARAAELGYAALAITDECSMAGAVRAHVAARDHGLPLILGSELSLDDGMRLVALGGVLGLLGSAVLAQLLSRLLFGVPALDPVTFLGVPLVLGGVGLLASWIPARRASRVDPAVALRAE